MLCLASLFLFGMVGAASAPDCTLTTSNHAGVYVARDSHASYEVACTSDCPNPSTGLFDEGPHNGQAAWTGAVSPPAQFGSWVSWGGRWGGSGNLIGSQVGVGDSPGSPGAAPSGRYACTQAAWTCSNAPDGAPLPPGRRHLLGATKAPPQSQCATWFDIGLTAFACSPTQLNQAFRTFALPKRGQFTLLVRGHRTGTAPGLVQVVGRPLNLGEVVRFRGKPAKDELAILNSVIHGKEYLIRLSRIRMHAHATAKVAFADGKALPILRGMTATIRIDLVRPREK